MGTGARCEGGGKQGGSWMELVVGFGGDVPFKSEEVPRLLLSGV